MTQIDKIESFMSEFLSQTLSLVSNLTVPAVLVVILGYGAFKRVKVYESFVEGAKGGFEVAFKIIPFLVGILVAIAMFRESGAMDYLVAVLAPVTKFIGMPAEALPLALLRPLSGGGSLALTTELMTTHGPDSFVGRLASVMYGSTETTFYVLALYFGSVGVKKTRHALLAGLLADAAGILAALWICRLVFG